MKRILIGAATALFMLAACETIEQVEAPDSHAGNVLSGTGSCGHASKDSVILTASIDAATKTYMSYSGGVYNLLWSDSDRIVVWDLESLDQESPVYEFFKIINGAGEATAEFVGTLQAETYVALYAGQYYYPYNGYPSIGFPNEQFDRPGNLSDFTNPMIAISDGRNFFFQNICSVLKVSVTGNGERLNSITVFSNNGEPMSGRVIVDFAESADGYEPVISFVESGNDDGGPFSWVDFYCNGAELSETPRDFYVVVPARVYQGGLGLALVTSDEQYMEVSTAEGIETKRSQMHEISVNFENQEEEVEDVLEDGVYIVGTAVGYPVPMLEAANRSGRYDRFVSIEKNTPFTIVKWENGVKTEYDIPEQGLCTAPGAPGIDYDWGRLSEGQSYGGMTVRKDGLYIVVVDMNEYGDLYAPQISAVPVDWKLRGSCNGWATTEMSMTYMSPTSINFVAEDVIFATSRAEYKFDFSYDWFISSLDYYNQSPEYSLITNLGVLESGALGYSGSNIPLGGSGVYDVMISWSMSDGLVSNEFSYSYERKGEAPVQDYSACRLELVGASVAEGSPDESSWLWDNVLCADKNGYPEVSGTTYIWTWSTWLYDEDDCNKYATKTPGFKIRTLNYQESGGIAAFDLGYSNVDTYNSDDVYALDISNIMVGESGNYDVTLTLDALTGEFTITVVMTGNTRFSGSHESL